MSLNPVSYTHLDVYKRQPLCWAALYFLTVLVLLPVSYTHLDVYKRQEVGRSFSSFRMSRLSHFFGVFLFFTDIFYVVSNLIMVLV